MNFFASFKFQNCILTMTAALIAAVSFFLIYPLQDPTGGDAYFYLKQTEWLANHFSFYHADYSLAFVPLALLYKISGSSLMAFKLVCLFNYFSIVFVIGSLLMQQLASFNVRLKLIGTISLLIAIACQVPTLRLGFEFIKNGFGLALFLWATLFLLRKEFKTAFILALAAALSHKTIALMFLLILFSYVIYFSKRRKILLTSTVILLATLLFLNPRLLDHLQNFISKIKLESAFSLFSLNSHLMWSHVLLIVFWLTVFISQAKRIIHSALETYQKIYLASLFIICLFPLLPLFQGENAEIKWRLMIFTFIFSQMLYIFSLAFIRSNRIIFAAIVLSLGLMSHEFFNQTNFPWVASWSDQITNPQALEEFVKPGDELITHHGLQFYIDYKTNIRARSLLTKDKKPKFQLAYIPNFFLLNPTQADAIQQIKLASVGYEYGLFYYEEFQQLIKEFPVLANPKNIFRPRPDFVQTY